MKSLIQSGVLLIVSVFFVSSAFAFGLSSLTGGSKSSAPAGPSVSQLCDLFDGANSDVCDAGFHATKGALSLEVIVADDQTKDKIDAQLESLNKCKTPDEKNKVCGDLMPTVSDGVNKGIDEGKYKTAKLTEDQLKEVPRVGFNVLLCALKDKSAIDRLSRVKDTAQAAIARAQADPISAAKDADKIAKLSSAIKTIPNVIDSANEQIKLAAVTGTAIKQLTVGNKIDSFKEPKATDTFSNGN